MKTISLKLPDELDAKLSSLAQRRRSTKSTIVRDALQAYLACSTPRGSFLELAKDLAGCIAGPGDLSYNKAHLKDFGK